MLAMQYDVMLVVLICHFQLLSDQRDKYPTKMFVSRNNIWDVVVTKYIALPLYYCTFISLTFEKVVAYNTICNLTELFKFNIS